MKARAKKNISYKKYVKTYMKRKATLEKKGYEMQYEMLDKTQFRVTYKAWYNTRMEQIKSGEKKTMGNIYGEIVSTQVSDVSYKQAKNILQAMKKEFAKQGETGKGKTKGLSILKIRQENMKEDPYMSEFWDIVSQDYDDLKQAGLTGKDAAEQLARTFFGSK